MFARANSRSSLSSARAPCLRTTKACGASPQRSCGSPTIVQCKRWKGKPVPVQTVRELYGVLHDRGASAAKLVATTSFTPDAIAFANGKPIQLVDSKTLIELIRGVQTSGRLKAQ